MALSWPQEHFSKQNGRVLLKASQLWPFAALEAVNPGSPGVNANLWSWLSFVTTSFLWLCIATVLLSSACGGMNSGVNLTGKERIASGSNYSMYKLYVATTPPPNTEANCTEFYLVDCQALTRQHTLWYRAF